MFTKNLHVANAMFKLQLLGLRTFQITRQLTVCHVNLCTSASTYTSTSTSTFSCTSTSTSASTSTWTPALTPALTSTSTSASTSVSTCTFTPAPTSTPMSVPVFFNNDQSLKNAGACWYANNTSHLDPCLCFQYLLAPRNSPKSFKRKPTIPCRVQTFVRTKSRRGWMCRTYLYHPLPLL